MSVSIHSRVRVSVVGASGYAGGELLRILCRHPRAEIRHVAGSAAGAGRRVAELHPRLRRQVDLRLEKLDIPRIAADSDVVFCALPHGESQRPVAAFLGKGRKVIDLSADFRLEVRQYQKWYGIRHTYPALVKEGVYGLPELYREKIRKARLVANPGCYATAVILAYAPLLRARLLRPDSLIADAASGVSGAGRKLEAAYLFCEVNESYRPYSVASHRHTPEMEEILSEVAGRTVRLTFTPHLLPTNRGILATCYGTLRRRVSETSLQNLYWKTYRDEPFLRILRTSLPSLAAVSDGNFCDLAVRLDKRTNRAIAFAALDNLTKGAAGQAIQNMNLMFGLAEDMGLR